jgi:excisionase family DNA binding protein
VTAPPAPAGPYADPQWATRDEVAARLGVSLKTIDRMVADGRLTKRTRDSDRRRVVFAVAQVESLLVPGGGAR